MTGEPAVPAVAARAGRLAGPFLGIHLVVNLANGGVANYLLPLRLGDLDPAGKVAALAAASTLAGVVAVVAQPLFGALSDRTRSRWGRRVPWIVIGSVGLSACFLGLTAATGVLAVVLIAAAVQGCYSATAAPLAALVPDRTPASARGRFSALAGVGVFLGTMLGVVVMAPFAADVDSGFRVLAAVALAAVPLALLLRRDPHPPPRRPRAGLRAGLASFWVSPRRHPDFAWAFLARLLLVTGFWSIYTFLLYLLQDHIGLDRDEAAATYPAVAAVMTLSLLATIVPAGLISDRTGRRKPVVVASSLLITASVVIMLVWPTLPALVVAMAVAGAATGAYMAVDQALMTLVLPGSADSGKDLGILNIAQAGGQVLAPAVAAVAIGAAGYPGLFVLAAVLGVLGAAAILPIRSVR